MKRSGFHFMKVTLGIIITASIILLSSCAKSELLGPRSYEFKNPIFKDYLVTLEDYEKDVNWYHIQGENHYGLWLDIFLWLGVLLGGLSSCFAAATIWGKKKKMKAVIIFILSILIVLASSGSYWFKIRTDRFFKENRIQYEKLSQEVDSLIRTFKTEFNKGLFSDGNIESRRSEFLDLINGTFNKIEACKQGYFDKYQINLTRPFRH